MSRRKPLVAAIAALCVAPAVLASDDVADRTPARDAAARVAAIRAKVAAAFAQNPQPVLAHDDDRTAPMGPMETIVARIGTDGKPVMSCFDTPEGVERFFALAAEQLPKPKHKEAKEQ